QARPAIRKNLGYGNEAIKLNPTAHQKLASQANALRNGAPAQVTSTASEAVIGATTYDLQTNGTISNRLTNNADGTYSAVWTMSLDADPAGGWPDRGTGYNYFDGFGWASSPPSARLEPVRTGFTNVAYTPGGYEATLAHNPAVGSPGSSFSSRTPKGTGTWNFTTLPGTTETTLWPKMAAGGANGQSFHAIYD